MILLLIWDGLRPDMITPERTPFLHNKAQEGAFCRASHAVFPTATRINSASLITGSYPGRHGIVDNELYVPALDPERATSCADWPALQAIADLEGGPLLNAPTLGEALRQAGLRMVSGGSGSPGTTYLTNPFVTGPVVNWAVAWPKTEQDEIERRYGGMLGPKSNSLDRNRFVVQALTDHLIPKYEPDVVTLWLTEPDHTQHDHGLGSPEALAMLRELDDQLRNLILFMEAGVGSEGLTCLVLSDHGFNTVIDRVNPGLELIAAGLKAAPNSNDIVRASGSLFLSGKARQRVPELVRFLASRPWIGALFLRDDLLAECPGAMPQSAVGGCHRRSAEIMFSYRWSHEANNYDAPGSVVHSASLVAIHGSTSPYAINNVLVAWGAKVREGIVSEVPCSIIDVAPTVLHLLGIDPSGDMDGRVLDELLHEGPYPRNVEVTSSARAFTYDTPVGPRRQVARFSTAAGHTYLDQVTMAAV